MSDIDLGWLADAIDAPVLSSAEPTHRVFMSILRDLIALHPHTRDVFNRSSGPSLRFGCRCCHTDEYEFTEGLGWCPTIRQIAVQNGIALPDNPGTPAPAITEENRAMATPPPVQGAPLPAAFQAPPADPQAPPPGYAYPAPAPAPVFQQPAAGPAPAAQPGAEPLAAVASAALQAEVQAETAPPGADIAVVAVQHGGQTYTVPADRETWPMDVLEALEDGKMVGAMRELLGKKQWPRFKRTEPTAGDLTRLYEAIGRACGFDGGMGES